MTTTTATTGRPLTFIKYNKDGDLLFTCAKDHHPTLWYADDGERVGTYIGHNGAVWTCDVTGALGVLGREIIPVSCRERTAATHAPCEEGTEGKANRSSVFLLVFWLFMYEVWGLFF